MGGRSFAETLSPCWHPSPPSLAVELLPPLLLALLLPVLQPPPLAPPPLLLRPCPSLPYQLCTLRAVGAPACPPCPTLRAFLQREGG